MSPRRPDPDNIASASQTLDLLAGGAQHRREWQAARRLRRARNELQRIPDLEKEISELQDSIITLADLLRQAEAEVRRLRGAGRRGDDE